MHFSESVRTAFGNSKAPTGHFVATITVEAIDRRRPVSPDTETLLATCKSAIEKLSADLTGDGYVWLPAADDDGVVLFGGARYLLCVVYLPADANDSHDGKLNDMTVDEITTTLGDSITDTVDEILESIAVHDLDQLIHVMSVHPGVEPVAIGNVSYLLQGVPTEDTPSYRSRLRRIVAYLVKLVQAQTEMRRRRSR